MSATFITVPPNSTGANVQGFSNSISGNTVVATAVAVVTSSGASCDPPAGNGLAVLGNVSSNNADSGSPIKIGGVYNSSLPVAASGARLDVQLDVNGRQLVTSSADGPVAAGAAASKSFLIGLVYNTSLPAPTNGQQVALQGDASGRLLATVSGDTAAAATDGGSPVKVGAVFLQSASLPAYTTGQRGNLQIDPAGTLKTGHMPLGTPVYGTANGAATANNVTLTVPANKMGYLDGFDLDGLGATAGSAIAVTITGILGGTLTFQIGIPAGVAVPFTLSKRFSPPLQASAVATNIVVNVPSYGSGNAAASTNAFGHYV